VQGKVVAEVGRFGWTHSVREVGGELGRLPSGLVQVVEAWAEQAMPLEL
jgi:hypothetical protein